MNTISTPPGRLFITALSFPLSHLSLALALADRLARLGFKAFLFARLVVILKTGKGLFALEEHPFVRVRINSGFLLQRKIWRHLDFCDLLL